MSDIISPLVACPAIQGRLNEMYNFNPSEPTPLTVFLNSQQNKQGIQLIPDYASPGMGKVRKVQVIYTPRVDESDVQTTLTTDCVSANQPAQTYAEYQIDTDTGVQYSETFNIRDLAVSCQANQDYVASRVRAGMDVLRRKMETDLTQALVLQVGKFAKNDTQRTASDRTVKYVSTVDATGKFVEDALTQIYFSARQAVFSGTPFIFGTNTIEKYFQALKAPANTYWGLNLSEYTNGQYIFMPDYRIADAFDFGGKERFVALDVNNFFILQYNKFAGMEGLNTLNNISAGFVQDIIVDPVTGVAFNYKWTYNPCGETASVFVSTAFQLGSVPDDIYNPADRLDGVKGSLVFEISNPIPTP